MPSKRRATMCCRALTIVELLVASVVMTTALVGIYGILQQALTAEGQACTRWNDRAAATAVTEMLANTLARAVNMPETKAIVCAKDNATGEQVLTCSAGPTGHQGGHLGVNSLSRLRYRWDFAEGDSRAGTLMLQTMNYAGSVNITPLSGVGELGEEELWQQVEAVVAGRRLSRLTVSFKPLDGFADPQVKWTGTWSGQAGDVVVLIRAEVGDVAVERYVVPYANGQFRE